MLDIQATLQERVEMQATGEYSDSQIFRPQSEIQAICEIQAKDTVEIQA